MIGISAAAESYFVEGAGIETHFLYRTYFPNFIRARFEVPSEGGGQYWAFIFSLPESRNSRVEP
jgi:hypothetical protein